MLLSKELLWKWYRRVFRLYFREDSRARKCEPTAQAPLNSANQYVPLWWHLCTLYVHACLAKMYLMWTLCTLYVHGCLAKMYLWWSSYLVFTRIPCQDVPLVEFIPCIYTHILPRCTSGGVHTLYLYAYLAKIYLWWSSYLAFMRISCQDVPLVEFMFLVFTRIPAESYRRQSGLCCCVCVASFER